MAFSLTSRNIRLDGLTLHAECRAVNGRWDANTLDLSEYIVTVCGRLYWSIDAEDGLRLNDAAECHLDENYLSARILEGDRIVESSISLDDCLCNSDGYLQFQPWHTPGRRRQLQETARKIRDLYEGLPSFSYRPLSHTRSIRLLRFSPPTNISYRSCRVVCQLVEYPLASAPTYSALSYTWGNPHTNGLDEGDPYNRTLPIECNGQLLEVGQNLHKVLRKIGKTMLTEETDLVNDETDLIYWAKHGQLENVVHWLHRGADVAAQDIFGKTALHWAAKHGHLDIVKVLVFAGSNRTTLDDSLKTPLECARDGQRDNWEAIESFLSQPLRESTSLCLSRGYGEYYWVDAICINQVDQAEKATQIALMGSIYENAKRVLAWIGSDSTCWFQQDTRTMLWHAWRLDEARQLGYLTEEALDRLIADPVHSELEVQGSPLQRIARDWLDHLGDMAVHLWLARTILYNRSWFERSWIIQEVVLAKELFVACGRQIMPWSTFIYMTCIVLWTRHHLALGQHPGGAGLVRQRQSNAIRTLKLRLGAAQISQALELARQRSAYRQQNQLSMTQALLLSRTALCRDLKDKIFSVTSITTFAEGVDEHAEALVLKYDQPTLTTFIQVSKAMLKTYGLRMLSLCGLQGGNSESVMPSWTLDLQTRVWSTPRGLRGISPSRSRNLLWTFSSTNELLIRGLRWDVVADVCRPTLESIATDAEVAISWLHLLPQIAYNNTSNPVRTLWRTLSKIDTDIEDAVELPDAAAYNSFLCWLRYVILMDVARPKLYMDVPRGVKFLPDVHGDYEPVEPWDFFDYAFRDHGRTTRRTKMARVWQLCKRAGIPLPDMPVCEINSELDVTYYYNIWIQNVLGAVQFVAHDTSIVPGQKLFRTGKHKKLGSGPGAMEAGDVIMYVPDTITPYVFRKKEDGKYWLIGEAYVHGVPQKPEQYDGELKAFFDSDGADFGENICIL